MELRPARSTRFLPAVLMLVIGLALVGLVMLAVPSTQASPMNVAPMITPTPGVNYELGNFCVDDYQPRSNCTANDVEIASLEPDLSEVCLAVGDTATVRFKANIVANSTERYDIGLFIATDGGSAQTGDLCYHDFLQPVTTGTPELTQGWGPFRETEPGIKSDNCGDTLQGESNFYFTQAEVTFICADNDSDGIVDPISTCLSWDNNTNGICTNVKNAFPSTDAKCRCEPIGTGTIIYRGLDFGDLPDTGSGTGMGNYETLRANTGPFHAVQDANNDGTPDTIGGVTAVWLGDRIDMETDGQPNTLASGDDINLVYSGGLNDEDGVTPSIGFPWSIDNGGSVAVNVSTSDGNACTMANPCKLAMYFDWNEDGVFGAGEETITDVVAGANTETFSISGITVLPTDVYSRFRLYRVAPQSPSYLPTGLVENGEVEDYKIELNPLGVVLLDFSVVCTGGRPEISWETASELYTQGFNVWRNTTSGGPQNKLNASVIPGHPGSPLGYTYSYLDTTAAYNTTYYFWLEDIDTSGVSTFNGPISVECQAPTSVGLDTVEANPAAGLPVGALPAAGLLALGAAGAAAVWLKRRRA